MYEKTFEVTEEMTAKAVGSGDLEVLATPVLTALVENTCRDYLNADMPDGETSVGTFIDIHHLKATQVGAEVEVRLTHVEAASKKIGFSYEVYEQENLIACGTHKRAVVTIKRFLEKLN